MCIECILKYKLYFVKFGERKGLKYFQLFQLTQRNV